LLISGRPKENSFYLFSHLPYQTRRLYLSQITGASPTPVRYDCYTIIPHPSEPHILLLREEDGWTLPHFEPEDRDTSSVGHIGAALREQLGLDVTVLRLVEFQRSRPPVNRAYTIYALENHSPGWAPPLDGRWVGRDELADLPLAVPAHGAILAAYFAEEETGTMPEQRAPWARPGWFAQAATWIEEQLARHGIIPRGPVEQVRSWGISCILRVPTSEGVVYFKAAAAPLFGMEPAITRLLAERHPERVPQLLAIDAGRAWMLLRDFGGRRLEDSPLEEWDDAVRLWGRMQHSFAGELDVLFAAGCPDRRLPVLAGQIGELLADPLTMDTLAADEAAQFRALAPRLKSLCAQLPAYNIPATLAHGDFHAGNIIRNGGNVIIYDWTDGCVAHPFLDMATIVEWMPEDTPEARARLWDAYLTAWTDYEPPERLREAARMGEVLGSLHQVVSYRHIAAALEPEARPEMLPGIPQWVRRMLKLAAAYGFIPE
jgi:hypothetical protein